MSVPTTVPRAAVPAHLGHLDLELPDGEVRSVTVARLLNAGYAGRDQAEVARHVAELAELGVPAEGRLGSAHPLEGVEEVLADSQFDEVIVATLPKRISRWLGSDMPHQIERRFGLPVTTIVSRA